MTNVLLSVQWPGMEAVTECTEPTLARYAERHNYDLQVASINGRFEGPSQQADPWIKIGLVRELMNDPDTNSVTWIDPGQMIVRFDRDIADDLEDTDYQGLIWEQNADSPSFAIHLEVWILRQDGRSGRLLHRIQEVGRKTLGGRTVRQAMYEVLGVDAGNIADGDFVPEPTAPSDLCVGIGRLAAEWKPAAPMYSTPDTPIINYAAMPDEMRLPMMRSMLAAMQADGLL